MFFFSTRHIWRNLSNDISKYFQPIGLLALLGSGFTMFFIEYFMILILRSHFKISSLDLFVEWHFSQVGRQCPWNSSSVLCVSSNKMKVFFFKQFSQHKNLSISLGGWVTDLTVESVKRLKFIHNCQWQFRSWNFCSSFLTPHPTPTPTPLSPLRRIVTATVINSRISESYSH